MSTTYYRFLDLLAEKSIIVDASSHVDVSVAQEAADRIGSETRIWRNCHIREHAVIGDRCTLGDGVYVDAHVRIGNGCKIQNNVSLYRGVRLEDNVFVGPSATFTNVRTPRAEFPVPVNRYKNTIVRKGATIGANATIVCGIKIGTYAFVAAGAVVTRDVKPFTLVKGVPARESGWVCMCAQPLDGREEECGSLEYRCQSCRRLYHYNPGKQQLELVEDASPTPGSES
jgi:UDP-2-acetamido-3-amino-2,3-dideoxy-glucuronate N-acetyltransferase